MHHSVVIFIEIRLNNLFVRRSWWWNIVPVLHNNEILSHRRMIFFILCTVQWKNFVQSDHEVFCKETTLDNHKHGDITPWWHIYRVERKRSNLWVVVLQRGSTYHHRSTGSQSMRWLLSSMNPFFVDIEME